MRFFWSLPQNLHPTRHPLHGTDAAIQPIRFGAQSAYSVCGKMRRAVMVARSKVPLTNASLTPPARIVVIEDNVSDVFLLDRALKKQEIPFELIHLVDGGRALAFIHRQGAYAKAPVPNLILMDLNLAKYTGEDILREIRAEKHLAGVLVCAWSSSQARRDEVLLKELGVSQFITKPSGLDQFMEIGKIIKDQLSGSASL
jgi:chemotaxis family two-component system response regulator Rcp1